MQRLPKIFLLLNLLFFTGTAYSFCELVFIATSGQSDSQIWSFSDGADCSNPPTTNLPSGAEYDYINGRLGQGYNVAKVFSTSEYKDAAGVIFDGINAILTGPERRPDIEGARQRAQVMGILTQALKAYENQILADLQKRNDETQKITLKTSIQIKEWDAASEQSKLAALHALLNAEQQVNLSENALVLSIEAFALSQAGLNVSLDKYEQLKKGALTPEALVTLQSSIQEELKSFSKTKKLDHLNGLLALIANEKNEYRKRQYLNLLSNFVDQNGLVKEWQVQVGRNFPLATSGSDPYGVKARNSMNLIMGSLVGSIEGGTADLQSIDENKQYLRLIASADHATALGVGYDKVRGQRLVNSGYAYAAFETKSSLSEQLKKTLLAAGSSEQFAALKNFGQVTSYESYVIVNAVNQFLAAGASNSSHASFYARLFVDKALSAMNLHDVPGFQAAIEGLQSLTDFKKGISEGVLIGGVDTVEGLWNLVTSPLESAEALYFAVVNYDRTYGAVRELIVQTISEMPQWDAQKWGQFQGRIAFEIGSALVGAKIIDSAGDIARLSKLSLGIDEAGGRLALGSQKALSVGISDASDAAEFANISARVGIVDEGDFSRLGNVIKYSDESWSDAIPADAHLIGKGDNLAVATTWYKKTEGTFDVIVHGNSNSFAVLHNGKYVYINHRDLAQYIAKEGWDGKTPIRLMSCKTGSCETGAAQNLANKLGVEVSAPTDTLWFHSNGRLTIGPTQNTNNGQWVTFYPRR